MACGLCGGTQVIHDWNPEGDACPECTEQGLSTESAEAARREAER